MSNSRVLKESNWDRKNIKYSNKLTLKLEQILSSSKRLVIPPDFIPPIVSNLGIYYS